MTVTVTMDLDTLVASLVGAESASDRLGHLTAALTTTDAGRVLAFLRDEAERYRQKDTHRSLLLADCVIECARATKRDDFRALGVMAKADALWLTGDYGAATAHYEEARQSFLDLGHTVGWARTFIGWVIARHYLGHGAQALAELEPARDALVAHAEWMRAAALDMNAGYVCWRLGRYAEALERFRQAQHIFQDKVPDSELKFAWLLGNQALVLTEMGEFDQAREQHSQARVVFEAHADTISVMRTDGYLADIALARGDYAQALGLYQETVRNLDAAQLGVDSAWNVLGMAECYLGLNRLDDAEALATAAARRFERFGSPTEVARARYFLAMARARQDRISEARDLLSDAARAFERTGQAALAAAVSVQLAALSGAEEDWSMMLAAAERGYERGAIARRPALEADAAVLRARALYELGRLTDASAVADQALSLITRLGLPQLAHRVEFLNGKIAASTGASVAALAWYERAMETIDRVQGQLAPDLRLQFLDDKLAVYHDAIDCALDLDRVGLAVRYLERAKSRALVDFLSGNASTAQLRYRDDERTRALLNEQQRLRTEHAWLYARLHRDDIGQRPPPNMPNDTAAADPAQLMAAVAERERRIIEMSDHLATRRAEHDDAESHMPGTDLGLDELLQSIGADTVIVQFYLRADGGAVFVLADGRLECVRLTTTEQAIRRLLQVWQLSLDATVQNLSEGGSTTHVANNMQGILGALFTALFAPIERHVRGKRHIIVIPYGPLHAVPFHALYSAGAFLVQHFQVTVCPSLRLLHILGRRPMRQGSALVLGHSAGGRLPAAVAEATMIASRLQGRLLLEEEATGRALAAACRDHAIIHVAAHGDSRLDNPAFAHVVLADGHLTTADAFGLDIAGALVVLSACESGRGLVSAGDDVIGLSRGFLFAGASTLVQSLWRVDDGATALLFDHFYRWLATGATPAQSMREAQRTLIEGGGPLAMPWYWAPFQVIGGVGMVEAPAMLS